MARLLLAASAFSAWLVLLFTGWSFGGAVHLLLLAALLLFPWREAARPVEDAPASQSEPDEEEDR